MLKLDAMFNLLGALMFFILSLLAQINPPAPDEDPIAQPGDLVVMVAWAQGPIDVDLWVQYGETRAIGYSNKSGAVWGLLRDDLGVTGDATPLNYESAFTRGLPDGEYAVNVRCYSCSGPVTAHVEVRLATGELVWEGAVELAEKQERTAVRWRISDEAVVPGSASTVFKQMNRGV